MLLGICGPSGSGKTMSSLLVAQGIAGPKGRVGMLDTENGRGEMYADSPTILKAMPNGYEYLRLDPPFSPARYIEYIKKMEAAGVSVLVTDTISHEDEGTGGIQDIAEEHKLGRSKNWAKAKMEHKKLTNHLLSSSIHNIFSIRAREKTKQEMVGGEMKYIPMGMQPIAEKNFVFEMLVSIMLDEKTHCATPIKVPEPLKGLFPGGQMLTLQDGQRIREWNDSGQSFDMGEQLLKRSRAAAEDGTRAYAEFYESLTTDQKKVVFDGPHTQNKVTAGRVDVRRAHEQDQMAS